jgi:ribosomal protein S18 acetylase RimI-like enzyme
MTETQIQLRRATPADAERIAALTDAAYEGYVALIGRKPQPMTADYRAIVAEHPVWLLCVDDTIAGVLVLMREPDAMLIYSVAVHPAHQGRGFGVRLLALAEDEARRAGYASIRLYTNALMEANIARYRRLGYQETGREPRGGTVIAHFVKQLGGPHGPSPC